MIDHIDEMSDAGVCSLKIEGRMKSEYYLATVINAYRRAIDSFYKIGDKYKENRMFYDELLKTNHRVFTTAYMLGENDETVNYSDSQSAGEKQFVANVIEGTNDEGYFLVEMRNRFKKSDALEILTPNDNFNSVVVVDKMADEDGNEIEDAKLVQQKLRIYSDVKVSAGDILRK